MTNVVGCHCSDGARLLSATKLDPGAEGNILDNVSLTGAGLVQLHRGAGHGHRDGGGAGHHGLGGERGVGGHRHRGLGERDGDGRGLVDDGGGLGPVSGGGGDGRALPVDDGPVACLDQPTRPTVGDHQTRAGGQGRGGQLVCRETSNHSCAGKS